MRILLLGGGGACMLSKVSSNSCAVNSSQIELHRSLLRH